MTNETPTGESKMTDDTMRKIADNRAGEIIGWMADGSINTDTGEPWTTDELTDYRREIFTEELEQLRQESA